MSIKLSIWSFWSYFRYKMKTVFFILLRGLLGRSYFWIGSNQLDSAWIGLNQLELGRISLICLESARIHLNWQESTQIVKRKSAWRDKFSCSFFFSWSTNVPFYTALFVYIMKIWEIFGSDFDKYSCECEWKDSAKTLTLLSITLLTSV